MLRAVALLRAPVPASVRLSLVPAAAAPLFAAGSGDPIASTPFDSSFDPVVGSSDVPVIPMSPLPAVPPCYDVELTDTATCDGDAAAGRRRI